MAQMRLSTPSVLFSSKERLLLEHPLFEGTRPELLRRFLSEIQERTAVRGTLVHAPGRAPSPLHLVLTGGLLAYQLTSEGRKLVLDVIEAGNIDGLLPMFGQPGHFSEAATNSRIAAIPWPVLEPLIEADPGILKTLMTIALRRLQRREDQLETMATVNRTQRLARQLSNLARAVGDGRGGKIVILRRRPTHQLLAEMVGVRRETVTLHLRRLVQLGAVQIGRHELSINRARLEQLIVQPAAFSGPSSDRSFTDRLRRIQRSIQQPVTASN